MATILMLMHLKAQAQNLLNKTVSKLRNSTPQTFLSHLFVCRIDATEGKKSALKN
jgi:hypothetical protein